MSTLLTLRRAGWGAAAGLILIGVAAWFAWPRPAPQAAFDQGMAAVRQRDWPAVLRCADRLKGRADFASHEKLLRGIALLNTGQFNAAMKEFAALDPVGDVREPALLAVGETFYLLDNLAEAGRMFATLAAEQPGNADAHRWLAAIAYDLGDFDRAMDELGIVIRLAPDDYRPHLLIGQMQFDLEQFRAAIESYTRAIAAHPPQDVWEELSTALARAQIENREYAAALETLSAAERSAVNLALRAECELSLGREAAARALLAEAEEHDPRQPELLALRGRMELDAGNPQAAIAPLQAVLELDPQDHKSRHQLSQALRLSGNAAAAKVEARRSAQIIEWKTQLALLTQDAIQRPNDADLRDRMAKLCDQLGKTQLAGSWRKAAAACRQMQRPAPQPEAQPERSSNGN